jgi:hypothetical protein
VIGRGGGALGEGSQRENAAPPPLIHTHTHARTHARARARAHTHTHTHTSTHIVDRRRDESPRGRLERTRGHPEGTMASNSQCKWVRLRPEGEGEGCWGRGVTGKGPPTHPCARTRTHARTHAPHLMRTHARARTHTRTRGLPPPCGRLEGTRASHSQCKRDLLLKACAAALKARGRLIHIHVNKGASFTA